MKRPSVRRVGAIAVASTALLIGGVIAAGAAQSVPSKLAPNQRTPYPLRIERKSPPRTARAGSGSSSASDVTSTESIAGGAAVIAPPPAGASPAVSQSQAMSDLAASHGQFPGILSASASQAPASVLLGLMTSNTDPTLVQAGGTLVWVITYTGVTQTPFGPGSVPYPGEPVASVTVAPIEQGQATFVALVDANSGAFIRAYAWQ